MGAEAGEGAAGVAWLDGRFLPLAEARVSVLDRGFLFADAVYEVIPVYARVPFRLEAHLARLARSLAAIGIPDPYPPAGWRALVEGLVARHDGADQAVYLHVTRGVAPRDPAIPPGLAPTVFGMSNALRRPTPTQVADGVAVVSAEDIRWARCDVKSTALLANVLLRRLSVEAGAAETVLFRDGLLTEGASSSVFVVQGGRIAAPPPSARLLPGISAAVVEELARAAGNAVEHREIPRAAVLAADEVWIASSSKEVLAVVSIDGAAVGDGRPGPVFRDMLARYRALTRATAGEGRPAP